MIIRKSRDRGPTDLGWLKSKHTFSFGGYFDPEQNGFESLRVINDDRVSPGAGFGTHAHNNMEIISYVLEGALEHRDSMGSGSVIRPGDVQLLSAGTGITHSEYNQSKTDEVHFLQIWILPDELGIDPGYQQKSFPDKDKRGKFCLLVSRSGRGGSVSLHQDVDVSAGLIDDCETVAYQISKERAVWVHIAKGGVAMNGINLDAGDGVAVQNEAELIFENGSNAEVLIFDMKPVSKQSLL